MIFYTYTKCLVSIFLIHLYHFLFYFVGKPPVLEAFLDLKQLMSSEKDSDTDFSSDSLQQPKVESIEAILTDITYINLYSNY